MAIKQSRLKRAGIGRRTYARASLAQTKKASASINAPVPKSNCEVGAWPSGASRFVPLPLSGFGVLRLHSIGTSPGSQMQSPQPQAQYAPLTLV